MTKTELQVEFLKQYDSYIKRMGSLSFREWLLSTDFFTAPASTRFHGNFDGGLCLHSLNVFRELIRLFKAYPEISQKYNISAETLAIISLLHDVCKANCYVPSFRNVKNDETGKWEKKPWYEFDEKTPIGGHGAKSVYLISQHMKLSEQEAAAIMCHMGSYEFSEMYGNVSKAYKTYPIAWLLHVADESASYIIEPNQSGI
jgi:hypothetical protein